MLTLDKLFLVLKKRHNNASTYSEKRQIMTQELGQVDVLDGPQHQNSLVCVRVLQLEVSSSC